MSRPKRDPIPQPSDSSLTKILCYVPNLETTFRYIKVEDEFRRLPTVWNHIFQFLNQNICIFIRMPLKLLPPQPPHGAFSNKLFSEPVMAVIIDIKYSDEMHRVVLKIAYMH